MDKKESPLMLKDGWWIGIHCSCLYWGNIYETETFLKLSEQQQASVGSINIMNKDQMITAYL